MAAKTSRENIGDLKKSVALSPVNFWCEQCQKRLIGVGLVATISTKMIPPFPFGI